MTVAKSTTTLLSTLPTGSTAEPTLHLHFPSVKVTAPGEYFERSLVQDAPTYSISKSVLSEAIAKDPHKRFILLSLDTDAPFPIAPFMGPIMHLLMTDLVGSGGSEGDDQSEDFVPLVQAPGHLPMVDYAAPAPPPASSPHKYIFLLYEQPPTLTQENFREILELDAPEKVGLGARIRFDQIGFEKKGGLNKVVAGNWFTSN